MTVARKLPSVRCFRGTNEHELSEVRGDKYPLRDGIVSKLGKDQVLSIDQRYMDLRRRRNR